MGGPELLRRWGLGVSGRPAGRKAALRKPLKRRILDGFRIFVCGLAPSRYGQK